MSAVPLDQQGYVALKIDQQCVCQLPAAAVCVFAVVLGSSSYAFVVLLTQCVVCAHAPRCLVVCVLLHAALVCVCLPPLTPVGVRLLLVVCSSYVR